MKKLGAFFTQERWNRIMVSFLLCVGVLWPMLLALDVDGSLLPATLAAAAVLALLTALSASRKARLIGICVVCGLGIVQLFLPNAGFFGAAYEALKAISLYFNGVTVAAPLFAGQIALLLAVLSAVLAYGFSAKSMGFVPGAVLVVMVLFGLWSLGKHSFIWYAAPALVALLLLVAQTSHEKTNLFQVVPMAAVLVALGLLIVPSGRTVVEPLNQAAMNLKQTISDYLFFTEPRNVFTLGSYGYYPMGSSRLGGPAEPTEYPVMIVKTEQKTLMRGVVKDEYTGRSWRDTSSGRRYLYVNPRWSSLRKSVFLEDMPPESVTKATTLLDQKAISVQVQNNVASTVFTPAYPRSVSTLSNMVIYFNDASELFITRDLEAQDRYTVYTPVFEGGDSALGALIEAAPEQDDGYETAMRTYLQLPDHLEQRVYEDMRNIIAQATTPYEQACAIQRHLQRYYQYSLTPEEPPENQDFVTYFLYVGRSGYCTYFASAMTVLCRMAGLPARYVEGFLAQPDGSGFAYVTGKDAHAWTEVYFEGFGWVPFDPTPAQQNLDSQENDNQNEPEPSPSPSPSPEPPDGQDPDDQPTPSPENPEESQQPQEEDQDPPEDTPPEEQPPFPWWWLLLVLAAVGGLTVRIYLCMPDRVAARKTDVQEKLFVYGNAVFAVMKLTKRMPRAGETPLFFARRMDKQHAFAAPILPLWRLLALSNYSRMQPGQEQVRKARDTFRAIYQPQRPLVKLRFLLTAAFDPKCYHGLETQLVHEEPASPYLLPSDSQKGKDRKKGFKGGAKGRNGGSGAKKQKSKNMAPTKPASAKDSAKTEKSVPPMTASKVGQAANASKQAKPAGKTVNAMPKQSPGHAAPGKRPTVGAPAQRRQGMPPRQGTMQRRPLDGRPSTHGQEKGPGPKT